MKREPAGPAVLAPTLIAESAEAVTRHERDVESWSDDTHVEAPGASDLIFEGTERFTFERELGSGGMGAVRLHLDRRIGRRIAVKSLHPELQASQAARARFLREAAVQGQLEHPSIVPVYDLGVDAGGALYLAMKRVRGVTFEEIIARRRNGEALEEERYGMRRLLSSFASVCLAVDFAHRRGVLHRDLKPSNVMLGDFGEVYVLDWGLARLSDGDVSATGDRVTASTPAGAATQAGLVLGTLGYMPPEQARGDHAAVGPAADVYALGAILFELLTAEELHPRESMPAIMKSTLEGANARASERAPRAQVPPELEAICVKATALAPADRYDSARALQKAVERYLDGERDVERRKQLAEEHVRTAREAAKRARDDASAVDVRRDGMRAIGRALALDPESHDAMQALVDLLSSPPSGMPPEVKREMEESMRRRVRWMGRVGVFGYASTLLYLPFLFWPGSSSRWRSSGSTDAWRSARRARPGPARARSPRRARCW
jgi:eukaryotic-like serine/threonine-protein kinase